jgi:hypothetical protein
VHPGRGGRCLDQHERKASAVQIGVFGKKLGEGCEPNGDGEGVASGQTVSRAKGAEVGVGAGEVACHMSLIARFTPQHAT